MASLVFMLVAQTCCEAKLMRTRSLLHTTYLQKVGQKICRAVSCKGCSHRLAEVGSSSGHDNRDRCYRFFDYEMKIMISSNLVAVHAVDSWKIWQRFLLCNV